MVVRVFLCLTFARLFVCSGNKDFQATYADYRIDEGGTLGTGCTQ